MRWKAAVGSGIAAAFVVAATGVPASSAPRAGAGDSDDERVHVVRVERDAGTAVLVDVDGSGGSSIGDEIVSTADFFAGGERVGNDGVVCTRVRAPEWFQCVATNSFRAGDLMVQFLADFSTPGNGRFAITGGTRAYAGATGEVAYVDRADPQRDEVTFRFVTPR